jgi:hypothetical protein
MKFIRLITFGNVIFADSSGRSLAVIVDSNPTGGTNVSVVSVVCCQVEVSVTV